MAKIIINTTAVRNNGDIALIFALEDALQQRGHDVTFATPHPNALFAIQKRKNACAEVLGYKFKIFRHRFFSDLSAILLLIFSKPYRQADAIIGAPGGYINSYYGFSWRRAIYRWSHVFGKRTAIYAQSIGPLNEHDLKGLKHFTHEVDVLMTRDQLSEINAKSAGFAGQKLVASIDGIFLSTPKVSSISPESNTIAISVREWHHDQRDSDHFKEMIFSLSKLILSNDFSIEFISTCQGIENYHDDSRLALDIADLIRARLGAEVPVSVNTQALSLLGLKEKIQGYRAVVGTRLHMCLLAMMNGVPAFNISYEAKGIESYKYLGLDQFSIDYNEDLAQAKQRFIEFLDNEGVIRKKLPSIMEAHHYRACSDFNLFTARLGI